jgi:hypothetical protein
MSDFNNATSTQLLDPYKRVRYSMGLVLGVPEFEQEQLYFLEKHQLHNRGLHGYGTVCGLHVSVRDPGTGLEVLVTPGLAVNPVGQEIRVTQSQCANLNAWLGRSSVQSEITGRIGGGTGSLTVYVTLCYDECEQDLVPIPGGPCRSQDDSMAPSRIADSFKLNLSFDPPAQVEGDVVVRFGQLLHRIEITDTGGTYTTQAELEELVRDLLNEPASPPESSFPVDDTLRIHPDEACDILRAMFRVWVTEVRCSLLESGKSCASGPPAEACVLLAELRFDIAGWAVSGDVDVDVTRRPILLHTRLLQEWLLCGRFDQRIELTRTFATLSLAAPDRVRAWIHFPSVVNVPIEAVSVFVDDSPVAAGVSSVTQVGIDLNVFDLALDTALSHGSRVAVQFDTAQMTEADTAKVLSVRIGDLEYAQLDRDGDVLIAYLVVTLPALDDLLDVALSEPVEGDLLMFDGARWVNGTVALDDLSDVSAGEPSEGDVLTFEEGQWVSGALVLDDLGDVDTSPREVGDVLKYDGEQWVPGTLALDDLSDVSSSEPVEGQVLTFDGTTWVPADPQGGGISGDAGGDLAETYPNPRVVALQHVPLADPEALELPLEDNMVLTLRGRTWFPRHLSPVLPFVTVTTVSNATYDLWFHVDAPRNLIQVADVREGLTVFLETNKSSTNPNLAFVQQLTITNVLNPVRNLFEVTVQVPTNATLGLLRFRFLLKGIRLSTGDTMLDYVNKQGIRFMGFEAGSGTVTAFARFGRVAVG